MSAANISPQLEWAASAPDPLDGAHRYAMAAKECVFTAQDKISRAYDWPSTTTRGEPSDRKRTALLRKLEQRLARVRAELERLDNEWRGAR